VAEKDGVPREDPAGAGEFLKKAGRTGLSAGRREHVVVVAVTGQLDEKRAKPGCSETFAEILHDAAIRGDAVKNDDGTDGTRRVRFDEADGERATGGGNDDIVVNGEWVGCREPHASEKTDEAKHRGNTRAAFHGRVEGRRKSA
jgi:hypothetical protein